MKEVLNILFTDLFRNIINSNRIKISQLNSVISLLIKEGIGFTLTFSPATPTVEPEALLTIHIRPGVSIQLRIIFDSGQFIS